MEGINASEYSAAGSALGYLAQVEYALLFLLQRMNTDVELDVSIETVEDITFHEGDGSVTELLQTKHHVTRSGSLGNASADLWKTMHNWIDEQKDTSAALILVTTQTAAPGTAAGYLRAGNERQVEEAARLLEETARTSNSATNRAYYTDFLGLSSDARRAVLDRVTIADDATRAIDLTKELSAAVRIATTSQRRPALVERLRGWWHGRVMYHLTSVANGRPDRISMIEIEDRLTSIANSLRDDNLPIDFDDAEQPETEAVEADDRAFVHQLRLIALGNQRLRQCIYDHNRAFAQRSRWQRERLLEVGELGRYDRRLVDEWRRHFTPLTDHESGGTEDEVQQRAREAFHRLDTSPLPPIRAQVPTGYVANGSLHILADRLEIGWHPDWVARLRALLPELAEQADEEGDVA